MKYESTVTFPKVNPLSDVDFDVNYPNERYRYVVDSLVLTGLSRCSGEAYAREIRILVRTFDRMLFLLSEGEARRFILERHNKLNGCAQRIDADLEINRRSRLNIVLRVCGVCLTQIYDNQILNISACAGEFSYNEYCCA